MEYPESRYTQPSDFCPHPEYWHSPDSEATESEVSEFIGSLVRIIQPEYVVETGTYHGHTTAEISDALFLNGHGHVDSIEKEQGEYLWAQSYLGLRPNVTLIHGNTMDFVPRQKIDFAFFDSWQQGRHEEFLRFFNLGKIRRGAIVAFHDTAPHHQVLQLVEEHLIDTGYITTIQFFTPRGLLLGQVIA